MSRDSGGIAADEARGVVDGVATSPLLVWIKDLRGILKLRNRFFDPWRDLKGAAIGASILDLAAVGFLLFASYNIIGDSLDWPAPDEQRVAVVGIGLLYGLAALSIGSVMIQSWIADAHDWLRYLSISRVLFAIFAWCVVGIFVFVLIALSNGRVIAADTQPLYDELDESLEELADSRQLIDRLQDDERVMAGEVEITELDVEGIFGWVPAVERFLDTAAEELRPGIIRNGADFREDIDRARAIVLARFTSDPDLNQTGLAALRSGNVEEARNLIRFSGSLHEFDRVVQSLVTFSKWSALVFGVVATITGVSFVVVRRTELRSLREHANWVDVNKRADKVELAVLSGSTPDPDDLVFIGLWRDPGYGWRKHPEFWEIVEARRPSAETIAEGTRSRRQQRVAGGKGEALTIESLAYAERFATAAQALVALGVVVFGLLVAVV